MNELNFTYGALVQNVQAKTNEWSLGDHRGDKQKYFKRDRVRLLTRDELAFIDNVVSVLSRDNIADFLCIERLMVYY